tara:strand:+ start:182 stop:1000 length:819 start_codon:yes stop_codon:yes gene_type:complete
MIVQTAPEGAPRFVIRMSEHTALSDQFAEAFGNDAFEPISDEAVRFVVMNHDAGWGDLDDEFRIDPATGFPYNLSETPFDLIIGTSARSPDFNESHHPLSGLLSSMHSWGLYNGRYGMSDIVLLDKVAEQNVSAAEKMLKGEQARQGRLKNALSNDTGTATSVEEDRLMQSYKQLQFFDTLALYFNRMHEGARETGHFPHVPLSAYEDVEVNVTPLGDNVYGVYPWPFTGDRLEASFEGRYMEAQADGVERVPDAAKLLVEIQAVTLVAAFD